MYAGSYNERSLVSRVSANRRLSENQPEHDWNREHGYACADPQIDDDLGYGGQVDLFLVRK